MKPASLIVAIRWPAPFLLGLATLGGVAVLNGRIGHNTLVKIYQLFNRRDEPLMAETTANSSLGGTDRTSNSVPTTVVGINLGSPSYYNTEWPFADPVQSNTQFVYAAPGSPQPEPLKSQLKRDVDGRPMDVPAGGRIVAAVQSNQPRMFAGRFNCRVSSGWEVASGGSSIKMVQSGTSFTVDVPRDLGNDPRFIIQLTATRDHAALSELSCRNIAYSGLFNPAFLDDLRPFRIVRFMDWMRTNNAPLRKWAERTTPRSLSQAGDEGVSLEHMVALCTQLTCDPWFTLPWEADDGYYRSFASYVRDHLPKDRKVYVELSNEVWNNGFSQSRDATRLGQQMYPKSSPVEATDFYYADRVRSLMKIWDDVFAGQQSRLVRVYGAQAAWPQRADIGLGHNDTYKFVDAVAIAPYLIEYLQGIPGQGEARIKVAFEKGPALINQAIQWSLASKGIANKYGLQLVTYEGGQHYVGFTPEASADLMAMQHDHRMYDIYSRFLERWKNEIGGPLVFYQSVGNGPWGAKDYTGQPLSDAPKMRAIVDFIERNKSGRL